LQQSPDVEHASYLKLKTLYMMGDQSRFEDQFRRFQPRTFEFKVRKAKVGILQALSAHLTHLAKERLEQYESLIHDFERWKSTNEVRDECVSMD
jgi:endonuclease/exonuclease/phosphatase family metal-dependent hydrolase